MRRTRMVQAAAAEIQKPDEQWRSELTREQYDVLRRGHQLVRAGLRARAADRRLATASPASSIRTNAPNPQPTIASHRRDRSAVRRTPPHRARTAPARLWAHSGMEHSFPLMVMPVARELEGSSCMAVRRGM